MGQIFFSACEIGPPSILGPKLAEMPKIKAFLLKLVSCKVK